MGMSVERLAALATIAAALVTVAAFCGLNIAGNLASRARSSPDPTVSPATPTPVAYATATPATPTPAAYATATPATPVPVAYPTATPATPVPVEYPTAAPATPAPASGLSIIVKAKSYHVQIQSPDGSYINLELHKGTVINPVGTILAPGMHVAVRGRQQPDGSVWTDQVDVQPPE
jgi:hypothetical protein